MYNLDVVNLSLEQRRELGLRFLRPVHRLVESTLDLG